MNRITPSLLLAAVTLFSSLVARAQAPSFAWAKQLYNTGINNTSTAYCVAADASGNVYTAGKFAGTVDFDPGSGTELLTAAGFSDFFVSKIDANGNFRWARAIGSGSADEAYGIATDPSGNVYVTGLFQNSADFDGGPDVFTLTPTGGGPNNADIFILKLDTDGNFLWAKNVGGPGSISAERGEGIAADASGNVFTIGSFNNTIDFDPGPGVFNMTSAGFFDIFILALDTNGDFIWADKMGGTQPEEGKAIALDGSGNIYAGGFFRGTSDFDPGAAMLNLTSTGLYDIWLAKFTAATGNLTWVKTIGGSDDDKLLGVTADPAGNVVYSGILMGTGDYDPGTSTFNLTASGSSDILISKLDANGNFAWAIGIGETNSDFGESIATDAAGNIYVTGSFWGQADFDPGAAVANLKTAGEHDVFISKFNTNGNFIWAGSMGYAGGQDDSGYGIDVDDSGNILTVGTFYSTTDFDPGNCTFNLSSPNRASFIQKMNPSSAASHTLTGFSPTSGPIGTTVNISGTGFSIAPADNLVEFNGQAAVVSASTATTITVTLPAGATTGKIKVTLGCNEATSATDFTVTSASGITFSTQPLSHAVCESSATTFTIAASGDTGLQYQWQINTNGFSNLSNNSSYSGVNTATLQVSAAGISLDGVVYRCLVKGDNVSDTPSATATLTVHTAPGEPAASSPDLGCAPASTILEPSGADGNENYNFYDAATGGNLLHSGPSFTTPSLQTTTTYYISIYNTSNLCESNRLAAVVKVQQCHAPVILASHATALTDGIATIDLSELISDADNNLDLATLQITKQPASGAHASISNMTLTVNYNGLPELESDNLTISVCDLTGLCTEELFTIEFTGDLIIYNGISVNDDLLNATWQIKNIERFAQTKKNKVMLFNRWGDEVFSTLNYDNKDRCFKGIGNGGDLLPSGTYFYKIEFESNFPDKTGYLVLKR